MAYQKKFNKPYPGGYRDFPDESTIITASVMDNYDNTLEDFDTEFESVDGKLEKLKSAFKFDESGNPVGVEVTGDVVANGVSLVETKEAVSANEANITKINSGLTNVESRVTSVEKKATDNADEIAMVGGRVNELKGDLGYYYVYDRSILTNVGYIDTAGNEISGLTSYGYSDFISIIGGTNIIINNCSTNTGCTVSWYDKNKSFIGGKGFESFVTEPTTVSIPISAYYIRLCSSIWGDDSFDCYFPLSDIVRNVIEKLPANNTKTINSIINRVFSAKSQIKIKLVGDSITYGEGASGYSPDGELIGTFFGNEVRRNTSQYCWANMFKAFMESKFNCVINNNAVSGTSFTNWRLQFDDYVKTEDDIIICLFGTNNRDLYTQTSEALEDDIKWCISKCNELGKDLIVVTPIQASVSNEQNEVYIRHIEDVSNIIKKCCIDTNTPFVDNTINMLDYCELKGISIDTLLADGLHPNDNGHTVLYRLICKGLGVSTKVDGATW